jgi:tRNA(fMet)-specific endonuclease VapC
MAARPETERPLFQAVRYLLDTCIIEALLKEETGHEKVRARIGAAPRGSLAISALTTVEIWTGITGAREPRAKRIAFEAWLKVMRVAPFDAAAAHQAFLIQRYLRQTGQQIGRTDPMIAAQAIAAGAVCVTDNLRHFLRIPGLTIENWLRVG